MSVCQQYVILPATPTPEMIESAAAFGYTIGYSSQRGEESVEVFADLLKAAPPPPEQVLDKTDIARIFREIYGGNRYGESELLFAQAIERAVLQHLQGAKNGE